MLIIFFKEIYMEITKHLPINQKIDLGSFYTPDRLVKIVYNYIKDDLKNDFIIADFSAGMGAFISTDYLKNTLVVDIDSYAVGHIKKTFPDVKAILKNSLLNVSREAYGLNEKTKLISIGNPPYNDITSLYKKGIKNDVLIADEDLLSRDLGIMFLKMFDKLEADIICILHPLSYLIKKANFNSLSKFKDNYLLEKGIIFSSSEFEDTSNTQFPIVISYYVRSKNSMKFSDIENFEFDVLNSDKKFKLKEFITTDGIVKKYPSKNQSILDLNIYFQTFRDINSLKRNMTFSLKRTKSSIGITVENLKHYTYLYCFKRFFKPKEPFIYGNLSPLLTDKLFFEVLDKNTLIYAFSDSKILKEYIKAYPDEFEQIKKYYKIDISLKEKETLEKWFKVYFNDIYI
jgi:hypothetical protein